MLGTRPPELKFFNMGHITIAGKSVRTLRHGMAGQPGFELFGPFAEGEAVNDAIVKAGEEFGLRLVGGRAYSANTLESGWIPSPLPAVYTGQKMKAYRQWLPADCYEATASIGGSFDSPNIEDYYLTPWDLGYGPHVKFDHDFIGREALEKRAKGPHRRKVTLALNTEDVMRAIGSQFQKDHRAKFIEFPSAVYSMHPYDKVTKNGKTIGVSTWVGYSANEGKMLTLAILDAEHADVGNRGDLRVGRGKRRHVQAGSRTPRPDGDPRDRLPGAVQRGGAHGVRRGRLAHRHAVGYFSSRCLKSRALSTPNDGLLRMPLILIGISLPPPPFLSKIGSTIRSSLLLKPVVICEIVASITTVPLKSIVSGNQRIRAGQAARSIRAHRT